MQHWNIYQEILINKFVIKSYNSKYLVPFHFNQNDLNNFPNITYVELRRNSDLFIDFHSKVLYIVRMGILVDANVYLAIILDEPEKKSIIDLTQNSELVSPLVLPYEIGNALSAMFKRNRLTKTQIIDCFDIYNTIPVRLIDVDIKVALQIASEFGIYAYDAYYLEVAKRFKFNLLSLDKKMMSVASNMGIHLLEV